MRTTYTTDGRLRTERTVGSFTVYGAYPYRVFRLRDGWRWQCYGCTSCKAHSTAKRAARAAKLTTANPDFQRLLVMGWENEQRVRPCIRSSQEKTVET
jgi:hypothetical protein